MASITHSELKQLRRQQLESAQNGKDSSPPRPAPFLPGMTSPTPTEGAARPTPKRPVAESDEALGYPVGSTDPKVFVPHVTARGQIPRRVVIQRKKAEYEKYQVVELLASEGIDYFREGPGGVIPDAPADGNLSSYLPLEAFDDSGYEERSVEDWLALGIAPDGLFKFVPAIALRYDDVEKGKWCQCKVLDWNEGEAKLLVEWVHHRRRVWLPRLHVMFLAEDPRLHAKRVVEAHRLRRRTESILRYHLYIDSMPIDESEPLDEAQLERIRDLSINTNLLLQNEENLDVASVVQEVSTDYSRTLNRILFDVNIKDPSQAELFKGIDMDLAEEEEPVPEFGQVKIPDHPFQTIMKSLQANTYLGEQEEVVLALQKVRQECEQMVKTSLFVLPPQIEQHLPIPLNRFTELQHSCIDQRCMMLKEQWSQNLRNAIRESLANTTEECEVFLMEKSREAYEKSKLKRMMVTVRFIMQDSLYSLTTSSLERLCEFIEDMCDFETTVHSLNNVTVIQDPKKKAAQGARGEGKTPEDDDEHRQEKKKTPLFKVDLIMDSGVFAYSTAQEEFKATVLAIYDKAVQYQASIPELEHQVLDQFFYNTMPTLPAVGAEDPKVVSWRERISDAVEHATQPLTHYLETYGAFVDLVQLDIEEYLKEFKEPKEGSPPTIAEMDREVQRHLDKKEEVLAQIPESITLGTFTVSCLEMRQKLTEKCIVLSQRVLDLMASMGRGKADHVCTEYKQLETEVKFPPVGMEKLVEKRKRFKAIPDETFEINNDIERMKEYYAVLDKYQHPLSADDFEMKWKAISWPRKLEDSIEREEELMEKDRERFLERLIIEQDEFVKETEQLGRRVGGFYKKTDIKKVSEIASEVKELGKKLDEAKAKAQSFNDREALFNRPKSGHEDLYQIIKDFQPYADLWTTADNWLTWHHSWTNDPFETLDPVKMEGNVNSAWKTMTKAVRTFKDKQPLLKIAEDIKGQIEEFRPVMPIVKYLRQPGMKDRHWLQLSKELNFEVRPNVTLTTMHDVYNLELQLHQDTIMKVSEVAMKEFQIEEQLNAMKREWEQLKFTITPYKDTGTFVMKGSDEIQQMLDEHIVSTQTLAFSPFKQHFNAEIEEWESSLRLVQEILEEWLVCQRNWLYLEPIFQSDDIARQLPSEWKRFTEVNKTWKDILGKANENPYVMTFCCTTKTEKDEDILPAFQVANVELEKVQKGLNDYLENKRSSFARFYFLSDDELLLILSEAKFPHKVNKQIRKLFENISLLEMTETECEMLGLHSATGEYMPFKEPVLPRKNVENWLGEVESMMKRSIRHQIELGLGTAQTMPRKEFIFAVTGQIAGIVLQTYWTADCERHLSENGTLSGYVEKANENLMILVDTVRDPALTKLQRINLGALITIEVHLKDIVELLTAEKVPSTDSFEWISQLRAYWEDDDSFIKQVEARFRYGGEYIGGYNMSRLVITPLTDRIYLTLTGAMNMFLGGAPAGPAGTGKTETVKDLAKALAKQCVVFNCQEGMDYKSMGKFFKGLANAGAWACFDEFNRIDVEVLSVVAQQVGKLQEAARTGVTDASKLRIMFEGSEIVVDPTNAVFITMNPGYAGRTELPDN
eukprot:Sspe_Gene.17654::Locus_6284_Transcript_1_1_Confidence_1.000_Length_4893::g.17654::m.17654/K10408/DNAH; dynein heavy chain, axonemal